MKKRSLPVAPSLCALASIFTAAFPGPARADSSWAPAASAPFPLDWSNGNNWDNQTSPNGIDQTATFTDLGAVNPSSNVPDLNANITLGHLVFNSTAVFYNISPDAIPPASVLSLQTTSGNATVVNQSSAFSDQTMKVLVNINSPTVVTVQNPGSEMNFSAGLGGSAALTIEGPGVTLVTASNTYLGPITVDSGILVPEAGNALGSGSLGTTINTGGRLALFQNVNIPTEKIFLNGGALGTYITGNSTLGGPVSLAADSSFAGSGTLNMNGVISGTANLTVSSGTYNLAANNTFSGHVNITGGDLLLSNTSNLLAVSQFTVTGGAIDVTRAAGLSTTSNNIRPNSVLLNGGALGLNADLSPAQFINADSTAGALAINVANFTNNQTNILDFNTLPLGNVLRLGSSLGGSLAANLTLIPDSTSHTFRFGITASASLNVFSTIADVAGQPTQIEIVPGTSATRFSGPNSYTGVTTVNGRLDLSSNTALGSSSGTPLDGTVVNANGSVSILTSSTVLGNEFFTMNGGSLNVNASGPVNLIAPSQIAGKLTGPITGSATMTINGIANFTGNVSFNGDIIVPANTLITTTPISIGNLTVAGIFQLQPATGATLVHSLTIAGTTNAWTGKVDLEANALIVHSDPDAESAALATLQNQVFYGLAHTTGILSSVALPANTVLAVFDNGSLASPFTTFATQPVDPNSLLIAPELRGDSNIDGKVDLTDLNTVLNNLGTPNTNWTSGNFDNAPTIDLTDLNDVLNNLGTTFTTPNAAQPAAPTPEPASLALVALPLFALLKRKRG